MRFPILSVVYLGSSVARGFTRSTRSSFHQPSSYAFRTRFSSHSTLPLAMTGGGGDGLSPPVAEREEDRVVLAGKDPGTALARQAENSKESLIDPPIPVKDPYGWMRDESRKDEKVLDYLAEENKYTESLTEHLKDLRTKLYSGMLSSVQETDYTTPRPKKNYYYYSRTFEGKSYAVYCRAPKADITASDLPTILSKWDKKAESPILPGETVILDVNKLAEGQKYCAPGAITTSSSQELIAYSVDYTGGETCSFKIQKLDDEEETILFDDTSLEISGSLVWGKDDNTIFYNKMDEAHRPYQLYRKTLDGGEDELLYEEKDELFWIGMGKSLDGKYLFLSTSSKETSEVHFLDLEDPDSKLQCVAKRRKKVLYEVDHRDGQWWIGSNIDETPNMRLMVSPAIANSEDQWKDVTNSDGNKIFDGGYEKDLSNVSTFRSHVVCSGREGGIPRVWILSFDDDSNDNSVNKVQMLKFDEEAHDVGLSANSEFDTNTIAVGYSSLVTPPSTIEISLSNPTSDRTVLKEKTVPGYDPSVYACERINVPSRDGSVEIPISIVYRKDLMEDHLKSGKTLPTHLYGYGSYGACMEASFSATRLTLMDRGMVYVIAHIRGGGEMGRQWYEEPNGAKYLCKMNTFNDFVDVAKYLIDDKKMTSGSQLSCEGRSAGGLLIGASINQAPELFKVAILGVPFVDVVCTMIDASIPLTVVEWEEWGCPNEEKYLDYMLSYSPTNCVKKAIYPSCLLTGGLYDPRVQFWEPTKFAAELRHTQEKESGPVCVKMDMSAGHFSASDRYKYYKELSFDYAFLLDQLGLASES